VKEKKNRQFGVRLESELAATIKKLSEQARLPMGEIIRLCVNQQLVDSSHLKSLTWKKKAVQFNLRFEDSLVKKLNGISRHTGLSQAEIVRLCLVRQFAQIRNDGGLKLKLDLDGK
jgi:predicted DNA-binding protein